jgi:hypothetical protein
MESAQKNQGEMDKNGQILEEITLEKESVWWGVRTF